MVEFCRIKLRPVQTGRGANDLGLLGGNENYDRTRILRDASRAQARGRIKKAITLYRRVLMVECSNAELHAKIAPLLARTGQYFDAWRSFRTAGRNLERIDRLDHALGTYREALRYLPHEIDAWLAVADLEVKLGRVRDAVKTLTKGRRHFRARHLRPQAICLLRSARTIDPLNGETVIGLARLLAKTKQRDEAELILNELASHSRGHQLRRVRAVQWRMTRTLATSWLWLRAAFAR